MFLAGFPDTTSIVAVNRLCSSGLEACSIIAAKIKAGVIDIGIGSGVESMSAYDMNSSVNVEKISEAVFEDEKARGCLIGMGETSENVAEKYGIDRLKQDQMAVDSHAKAYKAQQEGLFDSNYLLTQAKSLLLRPRSRTRMARRRKSPSVRTTVSARRPPLRALESSSLPSARPEPPLPVIALKFPTEQLQLCSLDAQLPRSSVSLSSPVSCITLLRDVLLRSWALVPQ